MNRRYYYSFIVQEADLDSFGHVNNAVYLKLYEQARWDLINQGGYSLQKIKDSGLGPTLLELKMSFLKELKERDQVIIESECLSYDRKIGKISQKMIRGDEICNTAEFTIGLFDIAARKLVLPTTDWLQAIGFSLT